MTLKVAFTQIVFKIVTDYIETGKETTPTHFYPRVKGSFSPKNSPKSSPKLPKKVAVEIDQNEATTEDENDQEDDHFSTKSEVDEVVRKAESCHDDHLSNLDKRVEGFEGCIKSVYYCQLCDFAFTTYHYALEHLRNYHKYKKEEAGDSFICEKIL